MSPFAGGYYFTGDGARRDEDGYLWVTGRVDDLMNVSGHLLSTAEIEGALCAHPRVRVSLSPLSLTLSLSLSLS